MIYNFKKIWEISYPILFGLIIQQIIGLTDTAFLGRVGEIELGASAIAGVFYIMIFMLGQGFSVGAQIIIARRNGEENYKRIGPVFYQGTAFLLLTAVAVIALILWNAPLILKQVVSSPNVLQASIDYLEPRVFGFVFAFLIVMFRAFYVGITDTKILTFNALLMLVVNVGLDYVLIFGKFGMPAMGIRGAAVASVVSEAVSALFFIVYTLKKTNLKKYGFDNIVIADMKTLGRILNISFWTMLQNVVSLSTWLMFILATEHLGENELAITNILRSISSLPFMISGALYGSANAITGNLIGSGNDDQVEKTAKKIILMGYAAGIALEMLMLISPYYVMRIYSDNIALINQAIPAYYAMLTTYLTLVPGFILLGVISGTGNTKQAMGLEFIALGVYTLTIWYVVIYLKADIAVCWLCEHPYNILLTYLTYRYLKKNNWCCKII